MRNKRSNKLVSSGFLMNNTEVYTIPHNIQTPPSHSDYWLYAPLSGIFMPVNDEELARLEKAHKFPHDCHDAEAVETLKMLLEKSDAKPVNYVNSPYDVCAMTILPNASCNFKCSYCYAASGHTNTELDEKKMKAALDFFIDPNRITTRDLHISFGGGGEPFLSWPLVKEGMNYASARARKFGFKMHFSFASNGSIMNDDIIETLLRYNVKANISFDILKKVQNLQRKNYETVCQTIDDLLKAGIIPSINTVITPDCVTLQEKMVIHVSKRFPKLKRLSFDAVVDADLFDNTAGFKKFYNSYTTGFFAARKTGKKFGIDVSCIKLKNIELLRERACPGGFDLTPQGSISMCFFVSSPLEKLYTDFIYGEVDDKCQVIFNAEKFRGMLDDNIHNAICKKCFAKWHCGGGCFFQNKTYSIKAKNILCNFIRVFTLTALIEKYDENKSV